MSTWNELAMLAEVDYRREQMLRAARRQRSRGERRAWRLRNRTSTHGEVPRRRWSLRVSEAWHAAR